MAAVAVGEGEALVTAEVGYELVEGMAVDRSAAVAMEGTAARAGVTARAAVALEVVLLGA